MKDQKLPSKKDAEKARALWAITRGNEVWPGGQEVALSVYEEVDVALQRAKQGLADQEIHSEQVSLSFCQYVAEGLENQSDEVIRWAAKETGLNEGLLQNLYSQKLAYWKTQGLRLANVEKSMLSEKDDVRALPTSRALKAWMDNNPPTPVGFLSKGTQESVFFPVGFASMVLLVAGYPLIYMTEPGHVGTDHLLARIIWAAAERVGWKASCFQLLIGEGATMAKTFIHHSDSSLVLCDPGLDGMEQLKELSRDQLPPFLFLMSDENSEQT